MPQPGHRWSHADVALSLSGVVQLYNIDTVSCIVTKVSRGQAIDTMAVLVMDAGYILFPTNKLVYITWMSPR